MIYTLCVMIYNLAVDDIHAKLRDLNLRFNVGDDASASRKQKARTDKREDNILPYGRMNNNRRDDHCS